MTSPIGHTASVFPSYAPMATSGRQISPGDDNASLSNLTASDWAAVSASAGHTSGPDANGNVSGPQSLLAYSIAADRADGALPAGQPLSVSYLQSSLSGGQSSAFVDQVHKAIAYLTAQTTDATVAQGRLDVTG